MSVHKSKDSLIDSLAQNSQKRRRELITLAQLITHGRKHEQPIVCRSAVLLAYAHWEGFVKHAATAYVDYVFFKTPTLESLTSNFQAIACRAEILVASKAAKKIRSHIKIVQRLRDDCCLNIRGVQASSIIDTESNLNSEVLENICLTLGIDYSMHWATHGPFIDDLLKNRCAIAHGELLEPSSKYTDEVVSFVQKSISRFSTDIENLTLQDSYLRIN